jgi:two-component system KDP operon response regulator KdpE
LGEQRRVASLDLGADDFIPKPFMPGELLARIRAAIRRAASAPSPPEGDGPAIQFDAKRSFVRVRGKDVPLSAIEHKFLALLARQPGTAVENRRACIKLWGGYSERTRKILYVIANRLRNKIETDPANPTHIVGQYGIGYRLDE